MGGDDCLRVAYVFRFHSAAGIFANFGARADDDDHLCTGIENMYMGPMPSLVSRIDPDFEASELTSRHGL
jgi:hypothetical protein